MIERADLVTRGIEEVNVILKQVMMVKEIIKDYVTRRNERKERFTTVEHFNAYFVAPQLGLRTLAVARRELSEKVYSKFASELTQAKQVSTFSLSLSTL